MPVHERREDATPPVSPNPTNRFALVIGNNAYVYCTPLCKAVNDARDMHQMMKSAHFQSTLLIDATQEELLLQKQTLIEALQQYTGNEPPVVCVFFAGHGGERERKTYLLGVDTQVGLEYEALLAELNTAAKGMTLIFLSDACRTDATNRILQRPKFEIGSDGEINAVSFSAKWWPDLVGLADTHITAPSFQLSDTVWNISSSNNNKMFIGHACKPGTVSVDCVSNRNSWFSLSLLKRLHIPTGRMLMLSFMEVINEVQTHTQGTDTQEPWSEGDVSAGKFVMFPLTMSLCKAAAEGDTHMITHILDRGGDVNERDISMSMNHTPALSWAVQNGHTDAVRLLLERGTDVNATNKLACTPLHIAGSHGHTHIAQLLLDRGAHVNAKDQNQFTPLSWAVQNGHTHTTQLLLERGADVNTRHEDQDTPLHRAAYSGHHEIAQVLLDMGANVNAKDASNLTPLDYAMHQNEHTAADVLRSRGGVVGDVCGDA
eukprot:GDKI01001819.1.p1 GENE.GDKI01001819.1~~GDKI01001819.1.p1  ORF type:complete len:488 (-),score=119.28 GDKI01001819.1:336-1799(-)